jgi:predicted transcriptional regulator
LTQRPNMDLAKIVLHELKRQPLYRTELEKLTLQKGGSHAAFESIFRWLIEKGYLHKSSPKFRAKYMITEKGAKFLELI